MEESCSGYCVGGQDSAPGVGRWQEGILGSQSLLLERFGTGLRDPPGTWEQEGRSGLRDPPGIPLQRLLLGWLQWTAWILVPVLLQAQGVLLEA